MVGKCRYWLAFTVLVALSIVTIAGCRRAPRASRIQPTPIPTALVPSKPTYTVQRGGIADEVKFEGRIAPIVEERLSFKTDGRIMAVRVKKGDQVKKGDVLAELDISDLLNQMAQAKLVLEQAQNRLKDAQQGNGTAATEAEIALAMAKLRLEKARAQSPAPSLAIAEANRDTAQSTLQSAQAAYDQRAQYPGVSGSGEAMALQHATQQMKIAQAQYDQALQNEKAYEVDLKLLEYDVRLAEMRVPKSDAATSDSMAQDVARAQLAVDGLQARLDNNRLIATIDGEVTLVGAAAGAAAQAYQTVITVAGPGGLEISADVLDAQVARLSLGLKATLTSSLYPGQTFHATIRSLPSPNDGGGTGTGVRPIEADYATRLTLDDAEGKFSRGDLINVVITLEKKENVLLLPPAAVRTFQGRLFVVLLDGDGQKRVPVEVGIKTDQMVEIKSGVEEGQVVVGP